jgi:hypothetical protein
LSCELEAEGSFELASLRGKFGLNEGMAVGLVGSEVRAVEAGRVGMKNELSVDSY